MRNSIAEYMESHDRCAVCYSDGSLSWNPIECHHLFGRYKKELANDPRNLIALCRSCHAGVHGDLGRSLSLGNVLWAKRDADGEGGKSGLDIAFLASLRNRVGLREDPIELPSWATEERKDNGKGWWSK